MVAAPCGVDSLKLRESVPSILLELSGENLSVTVVVVLSLKVMTAVTVTWTDAPVILNLSWLVEPKKSPLFGDVTVITPPKAQVKRKAKINTASFRITMNGCYQPHLFLLIQDVPVNEGVSPVYV